MAELGSDEYPEEVNIRGYKPNTKPHHGQILRAMNMIYDAKRPLFLIGGGAKIAGAQEEMCKLMETLKVPVVTTIMGRGIVPTNHELYYGNIGTVSYTHLIEKYDLKIKGKANTGLALCGDEYKIRLFILENIYEQLYLNFPL